MRRLFLAVLLAALVLAGYAFAEARRDPIVRRLSLGLEHWPDGTPPMRIALLSDIHIGSAATDAARLTRVVAQVNALKPSLVLIAGDFVAGDDVEKGMGYAARLSTPLASLRARYGAVAVLGNHDHWTSAQAVRAALAEAHIETLANGASERGPLAVVGIDDGFTDHADVAASFRAAAALPGIPIVLTHTPDAAALLPRGSTALVLAGHTHCGQAVFPVIGAVVGNSPRLNRRLYDPRFRCGAVRDGDRLVVVTGGIGASLPFRIGAPPDLWLLTLGPVTPAAAR